MKKFNITGTCIPNRHYIFKVERESTHIFPGKGYLVSFSFLKNKEYTAGYLSDIKNDEIKGIENKKIYEIVV